MAAVALAFGVSGGSGIAIAAGVGGLVFVGLFALGTKDKMRNPGPALTREGDLLVGGELDAPVPIAGTTFEIKTDYEGAFVIVLRGPWGSKRLASGGWKVGGERVTKPVADRVLRELGLTPAK